jgi:hypothetical protein
MEATPIGSCMQDSIDCEYAYIVHDSSHLKIGQRHGQGFYEGTVTSDYSYWCEYT